MRLVMKTAAGILLLHLLLTGKIGLAPAAEGEPFDPAARARALAPFLDSQTIAVARADLARLDAARLLDRLLQLVPDAEIAVEPIQQVHQQVLKTGARDVYLLLNLTDVPQRGPFAVVPAAPGADLDALTALLRSLPPPRQPWVVSRWQDAVYYGDPQILQRLQARAAGDDPAAAALTAALAEAFRAAGDTAVQILFLPSDDHRRVVEELLPTLPEQIGGGPATVLTHGVQWLAIGIDEGPQATVRLTIQSADAQSAAALRAWWLEVARRVSAAPQELLRRLGPLIAALAPAVEEDRLVLQLSEADGSLQPLLAAAAMPLQQARDRARRAKSMGHLKQIGLAMHHYYDARKRLPGIGNLDTEGRPLLSWRVHLLPYLEQQPLYERFRLDEPWDSDHNRGLIAQMPAVFLTPGSQHKPQDGQSTYRVVVGERTVFSGDEGIEFKQITDGTSNTIMVVEVGDPQAEIWTKPEGLPFDPDRPAAGLGGQFEGGFHCLLVDGSVRFLPLPADPEQLRRLLIRDDGQLVNW